MSSIAKAAMHAAKVAIRNVVKPGLALIPKEEKLRQSLAITNKLITNERFKGSHRIAIYISTEDEVNTDALIKKMFENHQECFIPKYDETGILMNMLKLHSYEDLNNLVLTKWQIRQPAEGDPRDDALETGGLDLMFVPGLAFSKKGCRIGRGKGYYDNYIDRCHHDPHGHPYIIGLAFKEQILPSIPMEDHDFPVDEVIYAE